MNDIRLVAFDLDGTLIDSRGDLANSINRALNLYAFPARELHEFNQIVGNGHHTAIARACPENTPDHIIDNILTHYLEDYDINCCFETYVYEGIRELTNELLIRNIKMAILTNKIEGTAKRVVDHFFPNKPFDVIQGNREGMALKPAPDSGIWLCETLHIPPENTIYLGDSGSDMTFANNVGFQAVGAAWGFRGREELLNAGANLVINSPIELLHFLDAK